MSSISVLEELQYISEVENAEIIVLYRILKNSIEYIYKSGGVMTHE